MQLRGGRSFVRRPLIYGTRIENIFHWEEAFGVRFGLFCIPPWICIRVPRVRRTVSLTAAERDYLQQAVRVAGPGDVSLAS